MPHRLCADKGEDQLQLGFDQPVRVEGAFRKQDFPDDRQYHRREKQLRQVVDRRSAEFPPFDTALEKAPNRVETPAHDVFPVVVDEVRMTRPFRQEEADHHRHARIRDAFHEIQHRSAHERFRGELGLLHDPYERLDASRDDVADNGLEQFFLGAEVKVQEALAHAGTTRYVLHARLGVAVFGKGLERGVGDLLRALILAALVPWLVHGLHSWALQRRREYSY